MSNRHDSTPPAADTVRLTAWLGGEVQDVGMRWWIRARSLELGLVGSAANRSDGRVEVIAEGSPAAAEALLALLAPEAAGPRPGRVAELTHRWSSARGELVGFVER